MTGLLLMNVILSTGIVVVIVGVLALAIKADRRPAVAPKLRTAAPSRSSAPQAMLGLGSAE